jgi:hypothetical protein
MHGTAGPLILFGDAFHNFVDGVVRHHFVFQAAPRVDREVMTPFVPKIFSVTSVNSVAEKYYLKETRHEGSREHDK